jgi:hypothetical protein
MGMGDPEHHSDERGYGWECDESLDKSTDIIEQGSAVLFVYEAVTRCGTHDAADPA